MSDRFLNTVELLLKGKVICDISHKEEARYLQDEKHLEEVNVFLIKLHRMVSKTSDGRGFYCVFTELNDEKKRRLVRTQLDSDFTNFNALVDWLRLTRNINSEARPLMAGDVIKESILLSAIENSASLGLQLEKIADKLQRAKGAINTKNRLRSVLDYLCTQGFLVSTSTSGAIYIATAKWSLLYDELEFIHSFDGFEEVSTQPVQTELF